MFIYVTGFVVYLRWWYRYCKKSVTCSCDWV